MARLPFLTTRDQLAPEAHAAFDAIADSRGSINTPYSIALHAPEVALRMLSIGNHLRFEANLPGWLRELAIIVAARQFDAAFVWAAHVPMALQEGVRQEAVDVVGSFGDTSSLKPEEAAVINYGRELIGEHTVSQPTWDALHDQLGDRALVELTALMGYYLMIACTLISNDVKAPEGRPQLPPRPASVSA